MKAITVRLSDEDYEALRYSAYVTRESVGAKAGQYLTVALKKILTSEVKDAEVKVEQTMTEADEKLITERGRQRGVEVALIDPVNTAEEAARKAKELKRIKEAGKAMEARYGK